MTPRRMLASLRSRPIFNSMNHRGVVLALLSAVVVRRADMAGLIGPLAILAACIAWELDNNLTRKVSLADPLQIVELKELIAGR